VLPNSPARPEGSYPGRDAHCVRVPLDGEVKESCQVDDEEFQRPFNVKCQDWENYNDFS